MSTRPESGIALARFRGSLGMPGEVQHRVLRDILARNRTCEFARHHGFGAIDGYPAYRERVPPSSYEDFRPAIDRMAHGEPGVLTDEPIVAWEETGGSSGGAKLVAYTASGLAEFRAGLIPWMEAMHALRPAAFAGRAYWSISPAARPHRCTPGGQPIGMPSDAAYFGEAMAQQLLASLAVPPQAGTIGDMATWRRHTLRCLVACEDLALVSVWSPTFFLRLLQWLQSDVEALARAWREAASSADGPTVTHSRIALLRDVAREPQPQWQALWPRLALISCWDHALAREPAERLRALFPDALVQGKGLLATEALVSVPIGAGCDPVLALDSGFFEFVDRAGRAHMADDVDIDEEYDLLVTTSSGLYRYAIGDRVRVTGRIEATPTLRFMGRSGIHSDVCGEKLDEAFVAGALRGIESAFAMLVVRRAPPGYVLVLDADTVDAARARAACVEVDAALCRNPQYAYARRLGQLAALDALRVRQPADAWIDRGLRRGQRLGDIKFPALCPDEDALQAFGSYP